LKLLQLKFRDRPPDARDRIESADSVELDRWTERVLTAELLGELCAE